MAQTQYAASVMLNLFNNTESGQGVEPSSVWGIQSAARVTVAGIPASFPDTLALSAVATIELIASSPMATVRTNRVATSSASYSTCRSDQSVDAFSITNTHMFLSPANDTLVPASSTLGPTIVVTQWDVGNGTISYHLNTASTSLTSAIPNGTLTRAASPAVTNFGAISCQRLTKYGYIFVCAAAAGVTQSAEPEMVIGYVPVPAQSGANASVFASADIAQNSAAPAVTKSLTLTTTTYDVTGVAPQNFVHTTFFGVTYIASSGSAAGNAAFWAIQPNDPNNITDFTYAYQSTLAPLNFVATGLCNYNYVCAIADLNVSPPRLLMSSPQVAVAGQGNLPILAYNKYSTARIFEWGECTYGGTPAACMILIPPVADSSLECAFAYLNTTTVLGWNGGAVQFSSLYVPQANESITAFSFVDASATNFKFAFAVVNSSTNAQTVYTTTFSTATGVWSTPFDIMTNVVTLFDRSITFVMGGRKGDGVLPSVSVVAYNSNSITAVNWTTFVFPVDDV